MTKNVDPALHSSMNIEDVANDNIKLLTHAMTVDVEDYFQVQALESAFPYQTWHHQELRVDRNTNRILDLFAAHDINATFFILGWVAERCPTLVRRIVAEGHEIASHGLCHTRVDRHTIETFREDIRQAKAILEDMTGSPIRGYRAPTFSISGCEAWAYEGLILEGYTYSSSVNPIVHDNYGHPNAIRVTHKPIKGSDFLELPMTTLSVLGRNLPCAGGGFFRLLPYRWSRFAFARAIVAEAHPGIFYFHPWEIDPKQPYIKNISWRSKVRHYTNLKVMEKKLQQMMCDFSWSRIDYVFPVSDQLLRHVA